MLRLRRLHIKKFRRLKPGTELVFNDGFNVLLGRNGTGKTQLLELLSAILKQDLRPYKSEAFEFEWEFKNGDQPAVIVAVKNWAASRKDDAEGWWFKVSTGEASYKFGTEEADELILNPPPRRKRKRGGVSLFTRNFVGRCLRRLRVQMTPNPYVFRFDEALQCFQAIIGSKKSGQLVVLETIEDDADSWIEDWFFLPAEFLNSDPLPKDWQPQFSSDHFDLPKTVSAALGAKAVLFTLRLAERLIDDEDVKSHYQGYDIRITFPDGRVTTAASLSFGQKRLLSFLYYAACNPNSIIADELVNGLHWEWIDLCLRTIESRQSFLTSQNPLLLDALPIDTPEAAKRTFIQCHAHSTDRGTTWTWQNLSDHDANTLWEAYNVGIQDIGDILRIRGMW